MVSHYLSPLTWDTAEPGGCWRAPDGCVLGLDLRSLADQGLAGSYGDWPWAYVLSETPQAGDDLIPLGSGRVDEVRPSGQSTRDAWRRCTGQQPIGDTLLDWVWSLATDQADPTGDTPLKPILPTREGNSELWLPLHSLVRSRRFAWRPGSDRYCNAVRDVLRRDLKSCAAADPRLAERALDAICRKHHCDPREISQQVKRGRATTTITDDFSGTLAAWDQHSKTWTIESSRLKNTYSGGTVERCRHTTALSSADHYSQCAVYGTLHGGATRLDAAAWNGYGCRAYSLGNLLVVDKVTSGSRSALAFPAISYSSGKVAKSSINGSTLKSYYDGVEKDSRTDTTHSGYLYCGVLASVQDQTSDDFYATDGLTSGGLYKRIVGGGVI